MKSYLKSIFKASVVTMWMASMCATVAAAPNTLQPEPGPFQYGIVGQKHLEALSRLQRLRGWDPSIGLLTETGEKVKMAVVEQGPDSSAVLRYFEIPRDKEWKEPLMVNKPISKKLDEDLERLWLQELMKVAYSESSSLVMGGMYFHFYAFDAAQRRELHGFAVTVGTPEKAKSLAELQDIALTLMLYAQAHAGSEESTTRLKELTDALAKRLEREP